MNGNVFECYEEQDDHLQYAKSLEALDAYTKVKLTFAVDLAPLFATKMATPVVTRPVAIAANADELAKMIFQEEVRAYVKRNQTLEGNLATVYSVAWGQCSEDMKARIKTHDRYEERAAANDCL